MIPVWGYRYCIKNQSMWMAHGFFKCLMEIDLNTGKVNKIKKIPFEMERSGVFTDILECNNSIWLIPCFADKVYVYDIEDESFRTIDLKYHTNRRAFYIDNNIYMIPAKSKDFVVIDICTSTYKTLSMKCERKIIEASLLNNRYIICLVEGENEFIILDTVNNEFEIKVIKQVKELHSFVIRNGYIYTIDSANGRLIRINLNNYSVEVLSMVINQGENYRIDFLNDSILIERINQKHELITINRLGEKKYLYLLNYSSESKYLNKYYRSFVLHDELDDYLIKMNDNTIEKWKDEKKTTVLSINLSDEMIHKIFRYFSFSNSVHIEDELYDLHKFIEGV